MRILLGISILVFALNSFVWGITDRDFRSKNGQVIRGSIVKYFEDGDVLMKRTSDLQLFRISLDIFTEDDQAFVKNNQITEMFSKNPDGIDADGFPGYRAEGLLSNRTTLKVPHKNDSSNPTKKNGYFAMGDNSTDSLDGRAWGFVPEDELIGRALFVYYPFTKRWGLK